MALQRDNRVKRCTLLRSGHKVSDVANLVGLTSNENIRYVLFIVCFGICMIEIIIMEYSRFFSKQVAREVTHNLAVILRHLVRGGSFPACCRLAHVVSVPKESYSSGVRSYRPISITPVLSKVFEKFMAGKLSNFFEGNSLLPQRSGIVDL